VDIVDGNNNLFIKRYIPDIKDQQGALNIQFLVRQYPGSVQTVASSTLVYSTTTKIDMTCNDVTSDMKLPIINSEVISQDLIKFEVIPESGKVADLFYNFKINKVIASKKYISLAFRNFVSFSLKDSISKAMFQSLRRVRPIVE
jgi:hypothetical protein